MVFSIADCLSCLNRFTQLFQRFTQFSLAVCKDGFVQSEDKYWVQNLDVKGPDLSQFHRSAKNTEGTTQNDFPT